MKKSNSKVSVVMPVHNVGPYISEAVSSVLGQSFSDFDFIIVDDGSTDETPRIIESFRDKRIHLFRRPRLGTVYQLNFGLSRARGDYIARQDGDDCSHETRFANQVAFLDGHPQYGVVSCAMQLIDGNDAPMGTLHYPAEPDFKKLMERCCISHPASMWRREIHEKVGGYDEEFNRNCCEDYDFWLRVVEHYRIFILDEILYTKREHSGSSISMTRWTYVPVYDELARKKAILRRSPETYGHVGRL